MQIRFQVTHIRYSSNDWHVLVGTADKPVIGYQGVTISPGESFDVTGESASTPYPGQTLLAQGEWVSTKYGEQFKAHTIAPPAGPLSGEDLILYLASPLIPGVGPTLAQSIVNAIGDKDSDEFITNPEQLTAISGISLAKAEAISTAWTEHAISRGAYAFLASVGISTAYAHKVFEYFGAEAEDVVQKNPYALTRVPGIGFTMADEVAATLADDGNYLSSLPRCEGAILCVLHNAFDSDGHVYLPRSQVAIAGLKLLLPAICQMEPNEKRELDRLETLADIYQKYSCKSLHLTVQRAIVALTEERTLIALQDAIYLPWSERDESDLASHIVRLLQAKDTVSQVALKELGTNVVVEAEAATDFTLTDEQRDAIRLTLEQPVCVLTGGPGTGKTTILHTLLCALGMLDLDVALASPTGRAAKRMEEATGWPASTLHRLLGFGREGVWDFYHDEQTPLDEEFIVVDEASMLDNTLAAALVRAIRTGSHLLLVGDVDQLPSVGAGNVLRDIIESGIVPVARLTQIHRQAEGNGVVSAAWRINNGSMPDLKNTTPHFAFVAEDTPDRIASAIVDLAVNQMPDLGYEADDIQVLAPIKRGAAGVWKLNEMLQDAFNPASLSGAAPVPGTSFRIGDRVMQLVNNYEKTVFNGDMGTLVAHDANRDVVWVTFDGREVSFERGEIRDNLVLAYAITVHKSQGSEYPVVIVPVTTSHWIMLQRNLLYTAITRASERVVLVGTSKAIAIAVKTATVQHRYTLLAGRLKHLGDDKTPL